MEKRAIRLSILLPTYNYVCVALVRSLQQQAASLDIDYEILVGDDGSTNKDIISQNRVIDDLPHCHYLRFDTNRGRSVIRNVLVSHAQYEWLLLLDCDMELCDMYFLANYVEQAVEGVIDGGICIGGDSQMLRHNIRFLYEQSSAPQHTATQRSAAPYKSFRTTNYLIERSIALAFPFDERFRHYGYEDVLFGKELERNSIPIKHIDNPMMLTCYESNPVFVAKTEEGLRTLYQFRNELRGYSHLLTTVHNLQHIIPLRIIRLFHRLAGRYIRRNLVGSHPFLCLFNIYKLGYYISLTNKTQ